MPSVEAGELVLSVWLWVEISSGRMAAGDSRDSLTVR